MEPLTIGFLGIAMLLVLIMLGVTLGIALLFVGIAGLWIMGVRGLESYVGGALFYSVWVYEFAVLPLFILMSAFAVNSGIAETAYSTILKWLRKVPGSLAIATTMGCALFGAVSGSAMATSAIFGRISLPIMDEYGYDKKLSLGCIAAAGTFACMIPPSALFIIYAILTGTSVTRLFLAGIIPGLITAVAYIAYIVIRVKINPELAPVPEHIAKITWKEKVASLPGGLPVFAIAVIVLGGIYSGTFTVAEGAAVGCLLTMLIGFVRVGWRKFDLMNALITTAYTTAQVFFIIVGAHFFTRFLTFTRVAFHASEWLISLPLPKEIIILCIFGLFFLLGMVIIPPGIMAMMLPVVFPVVVQLGYSPIWFGVIIMKASEIASVTPPVGLNVYVLKGVVGRGATLEQAFAGIWPFVVVDFIVLIFLIMFPQISLWLPSLL